MVARTFIAFDNDALVVTSSSSGGLVGNGIINNSDTPNGTEFVYNPGFGPQVVTVDDTSADPDIFDDDEEANHVITDGSGLVANGTQVESESQILIQEVDANGNLVGPVIELTVFSQGGVTQDVWGFGTTVPLTPGATYRKVGGDNAGDSTYTDFVACFAAGTRIRVPGGTRAVEDISTGDRVWTRDDPDAVVTWVGTTEVEAEGAFAPIVFAPGVIGNTRELVLSPEHRVAIDGSQAQLMFGEDTVLVAAKHLLGAPGVSQRSGGRITFCHIMFDRHRIVDAEGAPCESFYPGDMAMKAVDRAARDELVALFPELANGPDGYGPLAAACLKQHEAAALRIGA
ncbi:Hint domain-containing protein [Aestuariibius sp. 2305UL40-4]|uniref:Hint domain-containing protein n=1 Tax=Aestuariibius violaceus TaxID=3234132 RepID=UPI00345ED97C